MIYRIDTSAKDTEAPASCRRLPKNQETRRLEAGAPNSIRTFAEASCSHLELKNLRANATFSA
jgi:hypothetical protein